MFSRWRKFDNQWLIDAVADRYPDDVFLLDAVKNCTRTINGSYFVKPTRPNKENSEWQFEKSITLEDTIHGDVVLDVLKDGRIGSIEYLTDIIKSNK